jgi:hypothetical protein
MSTAGICSVCGTFLHLEECWKCSGTGRLRAWLVFWRKCPLCAGAGERALCPDRREHLFASAALRAGSGPDHDHGVKREAITSFARDRVRSAASMRVRHPRREVRAATAELSQGAPRS